MFNAPLDDIIISSEYVLSYNKKADPENTKTLKYQKYQKYQILQVKYQMFLPDLIPKKFDCCFFSRGKINSGLIFSASLLDSLRLGFTFIEIGWSFST